MATYQASSLSDLATIKAEVGDRAFVASLGIILDAVPANACVPGPASVLSTVPDIDPIGWTNSLLLNATPVTGIATDASLQAPIADGVATVGLPGTSANITPVALTPGGAATTIHTIAVPASRDIDVTAELQCSADDGSAGKRLRGSVVCTAKRYGSGALAITSQSAALPWACDDALWLPQFVPSSNDLLLQMTPDTTYTTQVRGRVRYEVTDTSGDEPPPEHTSDWLLAQITNGIGAKHLGLIIPDDFTVSGSDITVATTKYGSALTVRSAKAQASTVGARRHMSFARNSANTLYNAAYGTIKQAIYILNSPSLPFTSDENGFIVSSSDYNYAFGQAVASGSAVTGSVVHVDGVLTSTLTETAQVVSVSYNANSTAGIQIGGLYGIGNFGLVEASLGAIVLCNAVLTTGERQAVEAALALYQAG